MNVLFCGDIFTCFESKTTGRSGIFFVASALLKEFSSMEDVQITVYCAFDKRPAVERYLRIHHPELSIEIVRPLPHRRLIKKIYDINTKRAEAGLTAIRGIGKLDILCEALDKLCSGGDVKYYYKYDAFFSPCEAAPIAIEKTGMPIYTIIHDLIPIVTGEFTVGKGYWLYDVLNQVSPEKYYFCISESTRRDFLQYCSNVNPEHVRVIYNGYTPKTKSLKEEKMMQVIRDSGLTWERYILILGNVVPHKNVERQMKAGIRFIKELGLTDFRIAVVGSCNDSEGLLQKAQISPEDRKYIVFCGYVPDENIGAYYRGAFCLSFTSLYEGFGLPALEAMNEGCPVVTSNTSSLPEVVGDAAICIPPKDIDAHIEAYTQLLSDEVFRNELIARGRERVKRFRWDHTARKMMDAMKNGKTV